MNKLKLPEPNMTDKKKWYATERLARNKVLGAVLLIVVIAITIAVTIVEQDVPLPQYSGKVM
jgi:hypothetical protein